MARVIVILALLFLISVLVFAVTRRPSGASAGGDTTTVQLEDLPEDVKETVETSILNEEGATGAASAQEVMSRAVNGAAPTFATVGVDHKGRASFTGTATPGDVVSIARDGRTMGQATADRSGNWSIDFKVPPVQAEFDLHISAKGAAGHMVTGPQRALVSPATRNGGLPRITLMTAELKAAEVVEQPKEGEPKIGLIVEKATGGDGGLTVLSGRADPDAIIKATINDKSAGKAKVDASGRWSMAVRNETGRHASMVRLELISSAGSSLDHTDLPYKLPAAKVAEVAAPKPHASIVDESKSAGDTVIKIRRGDSLWRIAKRHYGNGRKWKAIYKANKDKIGDPNMIFAGGRLTLPG